MRHFLGRAAVSAALATAAIIPFAGIAQAAPAAGHDHHICHHGAHHIFCDFDDDEGLLEDLLDSLLGLV